MMVEGRGSRCVNFQITFRSHFYNTNSHEMIIIEGILSENSRSLSLSSMPSRPPAVISCYYLAREIEHDITNSDDQNHLIFFSLLSIKG